MSDTSLQIRTVRARLAQSDPRTRLGVERALDAADLYPPGLPAGAVLLVRRVEARPTAGTAWQHAVRAQLVTLARSAARPARGDSADNAEAVLFADAAELLACLADDIAQGTAPGRWWWRSYLRGDPPPPAQLSAVLAAAPRALPAALALLATRGHAARVLAWLAPPGALALAACVAATFQLGPLPLAAPAAVPAEPQAAPPLAPPIPARVPWPQTLPGGLAREQQLLLGLALTLHERHATVRTPAFRQALAAWWAAAPPHLATAPAPATRRRANSAPTPQPNGPSQEYASVPARPTEVSSGSAPAAATGPRRSAPTMDQPAAATGPHRSAPTMDQPAAPAYAPVTNQPAATPWPSGGTAAPDVPESDRAASQPQARPGPAPSAPPPDAQAPSMARRWSDPTTVAPIAPNPGAPHAADLAPLWPLAPAGNTRTELGGALFLINLLIHLGLPERFAADWALNTRVGAWGLLELFARALLADPTLYAADPLWALLARLDGREPGPAPGERQRLVRAASRPRSYQHRLATSLVTHAYYLPAAWLRQLPTDPDERYFWASAGRWLRVWAARGFVLFDGHMHQPGPAAARAILAELGLAAYPLARAASWQSSGLAPNDAWPAAINASPAWLRRWLELVLPYVRLRLSLALGRADPAADLGPALLARPGLISVSATHLDLAMNLASVSLPVRLAGLDRNPGWLGAYGRVITFYFVDPGEQEVDL